MMSTKERLVFNMLLAACQDFVYRYEDGKPKYKQHYLSMKMAIEIACPNGTASISDTSTELNAPKEQKQGEELNDPNSNTAASA